MRHDDQGFVPLATLPRVIYILHGVLLSVFKHVRFEAAMATRLKLPKRLLMWRCVSIENRHEELTCIHHSLNASQTIYTHQVSAK